ncbi:MAG: M48 family metalloprotease [Terriglobales bacterium]
MRRIIHILVALFGCVLLLETALPAQTGEYSDKDKKKLAEIAQRPEVQAKIQEEWTAIRRADMRFAYNVNTSTRLAEMSPAAIAEIREKFGQLYDNPILLRYVNALGQRLVPGNSPNLYSFRLLLDPVPKAEALSTGTIYVSTGLVSLLDNEAQLSYVLAHEIAHVERQHAFNRLRNGILDQELMKDKEADAAKKRTLFSALATAAGAGIGAAAGGGSGALYGGMAGLAAGAIASHFIYRNRFEPTEWSTEFENEADEAGLKYMLDQNFDAREIPRLYARLDNLVSRDNRIGLGFMGKPERVKERTAKVQNLLTGTYKAEIEAKLKGAGLTGSSPDFALLMSALKRDNGVVALDYDLFAIAKDNLAEAVSLRSNDPRANYYLGRVLALTARTPDDKQKAVGQFMKAIQYDAERGAYPEPHLEAALYLIAQNDPASQDQIKKELKTYVALYQREHGGHLPVNMPIIYDYFLLAGDTSWYVPPAAVVSTKNVESLSVTPITPAGAATAAEVVSHAVQATPASAVKPASLKEPETPKP